jgi:hypothetical protein
MKIGTGTFIGMLVGLCLVVGPSHTVAAVEELAITVVTLTNPVAVGGKGTLTIKTEVGAMCLGNRHSEPNSSDRGKLALKNVDREGTASWSWPVGPESTKGPWALSLQCSTGKKKGALHQTFEVR